MLSIKQKERAALTQTQLKPYLFDGNLNVNNGHGHFLYVCLTNLGFWTNYGKNTSNCESSKKSNDETTRPSDAFPSTSKTSCEIETTETVS